MDDGFLAITSLSRAMGGRAQLPDVGSMLWVILRQIVPCDAMVLFLPDAGREHVVAGYAAGAHAARLRGLMPPAASGIAGWAAMHRRSVLNAEPVFDLGEELPAAAIRLRLVTPFNT